MPLCLVGGAVAARLPAPAPPPGCQPSAIARHVPPGAPPAALAALAAGALPFSALLLELHFALGALWRSRPYYAPGFLLLALLLACALAAEAAVVLTYAALAAEEHRWWWRAFTAGGTPRKRIAARTRALTRPRGAGSVALYVAGYAAYYAAAGPLNLVGAASVLMYSLYSAIAVAGTFLAGGALGVAASHAFVRRLFSAVKAD